MIHVKDYLPKGKNTAADEKATMQGAELGRGVVDYKPIFAAAKKAGLQHYFGMIDDFAESAGVATPLLDCVVPLYERFMAMGLVDNDVAAMVDVIGALPREKK